MQNSANVGGGDRALRFVAGLILAVLPFVISPEQFGGPYVGYAMTAVGAILILTAAAGFCPLYRLIGVNTCRRVS